MEARCTNSVLERLRELAADTLGIRPDEIGPTESLFDIGLGSLDRLQFILEVEGEFGVEILDDDLHLITNLESLAEYIDTRCHKG